MVPWTLLLFLIDLLLPAVFAAQGCQTTQPSHLAAAQSSCWFPECSLLSLGLQLLHLPLPQRQCISIPWVWLSVGHDLAQTALLRVVSPLPPFPLGHFCTTVKMLTDFCLRFLETSLQIPLSPGSN
ncbi:hypothetical protein HJG60_011742 [Phyllostomus discolor]|uniref:Uncharacterized protein n=1 Tax=Phyllostomus discolor TaxID=89673 RepID=A0A833ZYN6_9CHIR|nr:hypothetical protein HJG60_011742 [Phyllostomus discolor]